MRKYHRLKVTAVSLLVTALILLGWYAWLAYPLYRYPPKLTCNFIAELNARIPGGLDDELAWPKYRDAIASLRPSHKAASELELPIDYWPMLKMDIPAVSTGGTCPIG